MNQSNDVLLDDRHDNQENGKKERLVEDAGNGGASALFAFSDLERLKQQNEFAQYERLHDRYAKYGEFEPLAP